MTRLLWGWTNQNDIQDFEGFFSGVNGCQRFEVRVKKDAREVTRFFGPVQRKFGAILSPS
jgi:hypothetical protein